MNKPYDSTVERNLVLVVNRYFDFTPERVFDAWLDEQALGRWLFATPGGVMKTVECDPRVGGRFRVLEQRGEVTADHFGEYLEIERPRRLVFTFATDHIETPSIVELDFRSVGTGCELRLTHRMEAKWSDYVARIEAGWSALLGGLARQLQAVTPAAGTPYIPPGFNTVTPYFFVKDAERFVTFLIEGLGGRESCRTLRQDGCIANAQIELGEGPQRSTVMVSEASRDYPPMAGSYYLYVADADVAMARALAAGAKLQMAVDEMPYGDRQGGVRDAHGNIWWISQRTLHEPYTP